MSPRQNLRDAVQPLCIRVETFLAQKDDGKPAQKFRRLQHYLFGLSNQEWTDLKMYFVCDEATGIRAQRDAWLRKHYWRLKFALLARSEEQRALMQDELQAYLAMKTEVEDNFRKCRSAEEQLDRTAKALGHTPIGRALRWNRARNDWHMSDWAASRCVEAGGCCARDCGCCLKHRNGYFKGWLGHCTPACQCCLEHLGVDRPIDGLECSGEPSFDVNPGWSDTQSRMMMRAHVWGLEKRKTTTPAAG